MSEETDGIEVPEAASDEVTKPADDGTPPVVIDDSEPVKPDVPVVIDPDGQGELPKIDRVLAILKDADGKLFLIPSTGTKELRKILKDYPATSMVEVWRGRRLKLRSETKVTF